MKAPVSCVTGDTDAAALTGPLDKLRCNTSGNVKVTSRDQARQSPVGSTVIPVLAGETLFDLDCQFVWTTGTTATGLTAWPA